MTRWHAAQTEYQSTPRTDEEAYEKTLNYDGDLISDTQYKVAHETVIKSLQFSVLFRYFLVAGGRTLDFRNTS